MLKVQIDIKPIEAALKEKADRVEVALGAAIENGAKCMITGRDAGNMSTTTSLYSEADRLKATPITIKKDMEKLRAAYVYSGGGKRKLTRFQTQQFVGAKKEVYEERKKRIGWTRDSLKFEEWDNAKEGRSTTLRNSRNWIRINTTGPKPFVDFYSKERGLCSMQDYENVINRVVAVNGKQLGGLVKSMIGEIL